MKTEKDIREKVLPIIKKGNISEAIKLQKELAYKYLKGGYIKNQKLEKEYNDEIRKLIIANENKSFYFPTNFYLFLSKECSTLGHRGYLEYSDYMLKIRNKFVKYCVHKRYDSDDTEIEPFVKIDENIFKAQSQLPQTFLKGTCLALLYTLILFLASYFILRYRLNKKQESMKPNLEPEEARMYFLLCENQSYMDQIFYYYQQQNNTICIDNVDGKDIDPGIGLHHTTSYFCKLLGANEERAVEYLEKLGINDLKHAKRTPEAVKKVYFASNLATDATIIVMKNFLEQESRDFERKLLALMPEEFEMDRTLIYLGEEVFINVSDFTCDASVEEYRFYDIPDPQKISLR